jgi:hypothetical protein
MRGGGRGAARAGARRGARRTMRRQQRRRARRRRRRRRLLIGGAVVLAGGAIAYKLGKRDAQRIEERSGKSVEEMSDDELKQYMNELNIQSQELTEEDQAAIDRYEKEGEPVSSDAPAGEPGYLNELERLGHLRDEGYITDEEFEAKKKDLLGL